MGKKHKKHKKASPTGKAPRGAGTSWDGHGSVHLRNLEAVQVYAPTGLKALRLAVDEVEAAYPEATILSVNVDYYESVFDDYAFGATIVVEASPEALSGLDDDA